MADDSMIAETLKDADQRMGKAIEALKRDLATLRTGRANPGLVEQLRVDYYGTMTPLQQLASVGVPEARLLMIQPYDKGSLDAIEKAIQKSDLGLNPSTSGQVIRIPLPPLTEERRRELGKVVHNEGENAKIAIRNIRRDAIHHAKELLKEKMISEDDERRAETEIQQVTDKFVAQVDELIVEKEQELLEF